MILLKLPDVPGDSEVVGYEKWISCSSISWSLAREFAESAKAGTKDVFTGVAEIAPIEIGKSFDNSSPKLMQLGAGGGAVGDVAEIHLLMTGAGGGAGMVDKKPRDNCYLQFLLADPIIASWGISGDEDARPTETLTLWYWRVHLNYKPFDGKAFGKKVWGGWDRRRSQQWIEQAWRS